MIRGKRIHLGRLPLSIGALAIPIFVLLAAGGVYAALQLGASKSESVNLQNGLAGHWKFDGNGVDSSGNGGNVTTSNITATTDRKAIANRAYSFAGTGSSFAPGPSGTTGSPLSFTTNFSLSAWVNPTSYHTAGYFGLKNGVVARGPATTFNYVLQVTDATTVSFIKRTGSEGLQFYNFTGLTDLTNQWTLLTATVEGNTLTLYVNGNAVGTRTVGAIAPGANDALYIGTDAGGNAEGAFIGSIDDVRIYNRPINPAEARALYAESSSYVKLGSGEKGLMGWWKLNGNTKDSTPYTQTGNVVNGATPTTDRRGMADGAYSLNGTDQYISLPTTSNFIVGQPNLTVSAWIKPTTLTGTTAVFTRNGPYLLWLDGANKRLYTGLLVGGTWYWAYSANNSIVANEWQHIAMTFDGTSRRLYVNGVQSGPTDLQVNGNIATNAGAPRIGMDPSAGGRFYFNGSIGDVRLYNRALNSQELIAQATSYNSQVNLNSSPTASQAYNLNSGLAAYWPFSGNARDATPYQRDGTISGATLTTDRKGVANRAYSFNGTSNYIDYGTGADYESTDFSVSVWAKSNVASPAHVTNLVGKGNWNVANNWYIGFKSGPALSFVYGSIWNTGPTYSVSNFNATQWHHYVGVATATQAKLYLDGTLVSTVNLTHGAVANTFPLQVGRSSYNNSYFNGSVDEVRLYKRALSAAEVAALFNTN